MTDTSPFHLSVIVPTYRRPLDLRRCIEALDRQTEPVFQIVIVVRDTDEATKAELARAPFAKSIEITITTVSGVVAALNAGLRVVRGSVIAFTDDDAAPRSDWAAKLRRTYEQFPHAAGVGGRDVIPHESGAPDTTVVGKIQWFGRLIGDHHRGIGPARIVDVLKGVNMSFRTQAVGDIRFDERLRGAGAQVHNELAFCLAVTRGSGALVYDPDITVDHYPAQRFDVDQRNAFAPEAYSNMAFNETLILLENLPLTRKLGFIFWAFLIGTRASPGLAQGIRLLPTSGARIWNAVAAVLAGRFAACRLHFFGRTRPVHS